MGGIPLSSHTLKRPWTTSPLLFRSLCEGSSQAPCTRWSHKSSSGHPLLRDLVPGEHKFDHKQRTCSRSRNELGARTYVLLQTETENMWQKIAQTPTTSSVWTSTTSLTLAMSLFVQYGRLHCRVGTRLDQGRNDAISISVGKVQDPPTGKTHLGEAEISDTNMAIRSQQQILRLEVSARGNTGATHEPCICYVLLCQMCPSSVDSAQISRGTSCVCWSSPTKVKLYH